MGEMMPQRQPGKYSPSFLKTRSTAAQAESSLGSLPLTIASIFDVRIVKLGRGEATIRRDDSRQIVEQLQQHDLQLS